MLWIKLKYIAFFLFFALSLVYVKFVINYAYTYNNDNSDYFLYVMLKKEFNFEKAFEQSLGEEYV